MGFKNKYIFYISVIFFFGVFVFLFSSCIVVKQEVKEEEFLPIVLSPKPTIPMSEEIVRSKKGDMISLLPKGWFFIDVENEVSSDVIAVAVNPDYTLAAVFSVLRKNEFVDEIFSKEGVLGLAKLSYEHRLNKSGGSIKMIGNFNVLDVGFFKFGYYQYVGSNSVLKSKNVVFKSDFDNYYEFALLQMNITGKPIPSEAEIEEIFNSILATIQY